MPKGDNVIHFSFPARYRDRLLELAQDGESLGLCAKRLLIEYLESVEKEEKEDRMIVLEQRLQAIEASLQAQKETTKRTRKAQI